MTGCIPRKKQTWKSHQTRSYPLSNHPQHHSRLAEECKASAAFSLDSVRSEIILPLSACVESAVANPL